MAKVKHTKIRSARRDSPIFTGGLRLMPALGYTKSTLNDPILAEPEKPQDPESTGKATTKPQRRAKKR